MEAKPLWEAPPPCPLMGRKTVKAYTSCKEKLKALHVLVAKKQAMERETKHQAERLAMGAAATCSCFCSSAFQSDLEELAGRSFAEWLQSVQSVSSLVNQPDLDLDMALVEEGRQSR